MSDSITLTSPLDMHLHLRQGAMLSFAAPFSAHAFSGALVMPNTLPPVTCLQSLHAYRKEILQATHDELFMPYMSIFLKPYPYAFFEEVRAHIIAMKLYPSGVTTNSHDGASDIKSLYPQFGYMQELGIILSVHAESASHGVFAREHAFIPILRQIAHDFPKLKIIFEHISTKEGLELVREYETIYGTLTLHHITHTIEDLMGEKLHPHLFCKPVLKTSRDRDALLEAALSADSKLMFGSDSAPHPREAKESIAGAAGIFSAPVLLPKLAELFDTHGCLANLQKFVSDNARAIYAITPPHKTITLKKEPFTVEASLKTKGIECVPLYASETIAWTLVSDE